MTQTIERRRTDYLPPVDRTLYLGSTDVAAILGRHPYKTPRQVYEQKVGIAEPQEPTERMIRGTDMELYCARAYSRRTGIKTMAARTYFVPGKPYLAATPDRRTDGRYRSSAARLVEIKTHDYPGARDEYGPEGTDQVPDYEMIQCQWEMHCAQVQQCDLAVWFSMSRWGIWPIAYDPEWGAELEEFATKWWETHVKGDTPPPLIGSLVDCEYIKRRFPVGREDIYCTATPLIEVMIEQHRSNLRSLRIAEESVDAVANMLREFMGEATVLHFGGPDQKPITWRNNRDAPPVLKIDWRAIAMTYGPPRELIDEHTTELQGKRGPRVFRVPYAREGKE